MLRSGDDPRASPRGWAWLALLTSLNVLNFVDRQLIASLGPLLIADLGLTRGQLGLLAGFAFVAVYTVTGVGLGVAADRMSRPRLIAGGLALWSVMTALSGAARSFVHLAIPRVLVGVGEATLTPAALPMLADTLPARLLGLASGIYYAGIPLGNALSLAVAGWIAPRYGWRSCFVVLGAAGLLGSALLMLLRDPRESRAPVPPPDRAAGSQTDVSGRPSDPTVAAYLRSAPACLLTILGGALLAYGSASAILTLTWLVQERGFPFAEAAFRAGLVAVASGLVGNVAGGWFADACERRWAGGRLWSLVILTAVSAPCALVFYTARPGTTVFYAAWFVTSAWMAAYFGPLFAIVQALAPVHLRSTVVAIGLFGVNMLGVGPGPWITGSIGDRASLTRGLVISVGVAAASVVPFALAARRYERERRYTHGAGPARMLTGAGRPT